jgi:hypothetical protein
MQNLCTLRSLQTKQGMWRLRGTKCSFLSFRVYQSAPSIQRLHARCGNGGYAVKADVSRRFVSIEPCTLCMAEHLLSESSASTCFLSFIHLSRVSRPYVCCNPDLHLGPTLFLNPFTVSRTRIHHLLLHQPSRCRWRNLTDRAAHSPLSANEQTRNRTYIQVPLHYIPPPTLEITINSPPTSPGSLV